MIDASRSARSLRTVPVETDCSPSASRSPLPQADSNTPNANPHASNPSANLML